MKSVTALEFSSLTDTGVVRSHNEDFVAISPDCAIAILAEGIGAYCADEVLSSIATSMLQGVLGKGSDSVRRPPRLRSDTTGRFISFWLNRSSRSISRFLMRRDLIPRIKGIKLVTALFHDDMITIVNAGDLRANLFQGGEFV